MVSRLFSLLAGAYLLVSDNNVPMLPEIRFHDLRHSAATLLLSLGVHPKIVQELLGHTQISMTMDVYSHMLPGMQQDAMSRLNDVFQRQERDEKGATAREH